MARLCVAFISQLALSVYHQVMLAMSVNGVNGVKSKTPIMDLLSYGAQEIYIRPYVICDACESKRASSSICHQCYCLYLEKENVDLKRSLIEKDKVLSRIQRLTTLFEKKCAKTLAWSLVFAHFFPKSACWAQSGQPAKKRRRSDEDSS
jgi:hypothetical protein